MRIPSKTVWMQLVSQSVLFQDHGSSMLSSALAVVEESYGTAMSALAAAELRQEAKADAGREKDTARNKDVTHHKNKVNKSSKDSRKM